MIKNIDRVLVLSLFGGYTLKLLALGAQPADAAVVLVLAAAHFAYNSQIQNKKMKELEDRIDTVQKFNSDLTAQISDVKSIVTGMKLNANLRNVK